MLRFENLTRELTEMHMAQLLAIIKNEPHEYWERSHFMHELPNKWKRSIIAFDGNDVAGFIVANDRSERNVHINKFMVSPVLRGKGFGTELLGAFCERLPKITANITLKVYRDNARAQQFYNKHQFFHLLTNGDLCQMIKCFRPLNTVAIHQPNFAPWAGYFSKMKQSDIFILLDDVQFTKNSFINRVQLCIDGKANWLTLAVKDKGLDTLIRDVPLHSFDYHSKKILKNLYFNYRKAPYFNEVYPCLEQLFACSFTHLADLNFAIISMLVNQLGISTLIARSSQIRVPDLSMDVNGRLIVLCKLAGTATYVSGTGGFNYQDVLKFESNGIKVVPMNFKPTPYQQLRVESFIPGMSIIDSAFSIGWKSTYEQL